MWGGFLSGAKEEQANYAQGKSNQNGPAKSAGIH
jgi:hypothetical protein